MVDIISSGTIATGSSYNISGALIAIYGTANNFTIANGAIINIEAGGLTNNTIVSSGGNEVIHSGGVASQTTLLTGSFQTISIGGISESTTISSGAIQNISSGGIAHGTIIEGGTQTLFAGGTANNTTIYDGTQTIARDAVANDTIVNGGTQTVTMGQANNTVINGGTQAVTMGQINNTTVNNTGLLYNNRGTLSGTIINSGGFAATYGGSVTAGGVTYTAQSIDATINAGGQEIIGMLPSNSTLSPGQSYNAKIYGSQFVYSGSFAGNATIFDGGYQDIKSGATVSETTVSSGGLLNIEDGGIIQGVITLEDGGLATIYNNAGGAINLVGDTNGGLTIFGLANGGEATTVITVISGFSGQRAGNSDIIKLSGINQKDVKSVEYIDASGNANGDYVTITLTNGRTITLHIIGAEAAGYTLGTGDDGSLTYEVCFLTGAMIRTPNGEKAVEDLRIGDEVLTFDWKHNQEKVNPICWIGQKKTTVTSDGLADEAGYPVRILKDAFATGVPYKDLLVTPEHCFFFGNKFIPIRMLVNNSSIYYDYTITEYTYYHIETEEHSIIWADGALTESYLDTGNRSSFKQHGNLVLFSKPSKPKNWDIHGGAVLCIQRSIVEPIHNKIAQRAKTMGMKQTCAPLSLTDDPDFHLITDNGVIIKPHVHKENKYTFLLSENVERVYLHSRTSRPCDAIGSFIDDRRHLGVLVGDIFIFTYNKTYQIKDHLLQTNLTGWDILEHESYRWTNGHAQLDLRQHVAKRRILIIDIHSSNSYVINNKSDLIKKQNIA